MGSEPPNIGSAGLAHILGKAREAADLGRPGPLSTGEALAAALVLNRPDWLAAMNFTIAEAIERIGPEWARLIPAAAKHFERDSQEAAYASAEDARRALSAEIISRQPGDKVVDLSAKLVTSGNAPGYRDVNFTFDLKPVENGDLPPIRASIRIGPEDGEELVREIADVHRFAWRNCAPIDVKAGEQRPAWIDGR